MTKLNYCWVLFFLVASLIACSEQSEPVPALKTTVINNIATHENIRIVGRVDKSDSGSIRFAYPAVSVEFNFRGSGVTVGISSSSGNTYVDALIDGKLQTYAIPAADSETGAVTELELLRPDSIGEHTVKLINRSETWHGITELSKITVHQGELLAAPKVSTKKMIVVGDSITCGEAIDHPPECGTKAPSWWNPAQSYGMLVGEALDSQVHLVCMGGHGLIRTWDGKTDQVNAPEYFDLAIVNGEESVPWDHSQYVPDLVYIALGTNDFSGSAGPMPTEEEYIPAYVEFVEKILALNPNVNIAMTEGVMLGGKEKETLLAYLNLVKERVASDRVHVVPSTRYPGDECDFHPNKQQHKLMAEDLIPVLKELI